MSYPCIFEGCCRSFCDPTSRKKHAVVHCGDKPHRCQHCMMSFSDYATMTFHVKTYHDIKKPVSSQPGHKEEFWCPYCASSFSSIAAVDTHISAEHQAANLHSVDDSAIGVVEKCTQRPYDRVLSLRCTYKGCNRTFAWSHHLQYHIKTHESNRAFECYLDGCTKTFYTAQQRDIHVKSHTGEKNFACVVVGCYKRFTTAQNLTNHIRIHTGVKPYKCTHTDCDKLFTEYSSLKKHSVTHTGDKPYQCLQCERAFTQSSSLRTHVKRRHKNTDNVNATPTITGDSSNTKTHKEGLKATQQTLSLGLSQSSSNVHLQYVHIVDKGWERSSFESKTESPVILTSDSSTSVIVVSQPSESVVMPSFYDDHEASLGVNDVEVHDNDYSLCTEIPSIKISSDVAVSDVIMQSCESKAETE